MQSHVAASPAGLQSTSEAHTTMQTFDQVLGSLSAVEVLLMSSRINDLRETMQPGQVAASALCGYP